MVASSSRAVAERTVGTACLGIRSPTRHSAAARCSSVGIGRRAIASAAKVPRCGLLLTAGADVQKDRIEVSVWAWGRDKQSWLVEHRVIDGDTSRDEVWAALTAMLDGTWPHETGAEIPIRRLAVDSGYATQEVYAWARRQARPLDQSAASESRRRPAVRTSACGRLFSWQGPSSP